jgi:hypothetical protein
LRPTLLAPAIISCAAALLAAPASAQTPPASAVERVYDASPLQRELPGFPKPRPGKGGDGGGGTLNISLGGGGGGDGLGDGAGVGDGSGGGAGELGAGGRGAQGSGGGTLNVELRGGGQGSGDQGERPRITREAAREDAREAMRGLPAAGDGQGGGDLKVNVSGSGGAGEVGQQTGGGAGEQGGAGQGDDGPAAAEAPPKKPQIAPPPEPPKVAPPRANPTESIKTLVLSALIVVLLLCLIVWISRRVKERGEQAAAVDAAPQAALLAELEARAGAGDPASLAGAGRFSEAIHGLLLEALRALLAARAELGAPSMTARAISARAGVGERGDEALGELVSAAELCVFAGRMADEALYRRCVEAASTFHAQLRQRGTT